MSIILILFYGLIIPLNGFTCESSSAIEKKSVCGLSWGDATMKCRVCCVLNTDCPANEFCWAGAPVCFRNINPINYNTSISPTLSPSASTTAVTTTASPTLLRRSTTTTTTSIISSTTLEPTLSPIMNELIVNDTNNFNADETGNENGNNKFNYIILLYIFAATLVVTALVCVICIFKNGVKRKHNGVKKYDVKITKEIIESENGRSIKVKHMAIPSTSSMNHSRGKSSEHLKDIFDQYIKEQTHTISNHSEDTIIVTKPDVKDT